MAELESGIQVTLAAILIADITDGDTAYIWHNQRNHLMVFDEDDESATDMSSRPLKLRPGDYGAGGLTGVWVEDVEGGTPYDAWGGGQIVTGAIRSTNWGATEGSEYDLDGAKFRLGGSDITWSDIVAGTAPAGVFMGLASSVYKFNVGDSGSYIRWDGSAFAIKMASGETFDLLGNLGVGEGGTIRLTGTHVSSDPGIICFDDVNSAYDFGIGVATSYSAMLIAPFRQTGSAPTLYIGGPGVSGYMNHPDSSSTYAQAWGLVNVDTARGVSMEIGNALTSLFHVLSSGAPMLSIANGAIYGFVASFGCDVGIGVTYPNSPLEIGFSTENLEFVDAGSTGATEQDWIEVQVGGNTGYVRVFASK